MSPPTRLGLTRVVGGLELRVRFAHQEDLDRVVHAARSVGWAPDFDIEHRDWDEAGARIRCSPSISRTQTSRTPSFGA